MTALEKRAKNLIAGLTTSQLLDQWESTSDIADPNIPTVRGWPNWRRDSQNSLTHGWTVIAETKNSENSFSHREVETLWQQQLFSFHRHTVTSF